jgi:hypothetical protein
MPSTAKGFGIRAKKLAGSKQFSEQMAEAITRGLDFRQAKCAVDGLSLRR